MKSRLFTKPPPAALLRSVCQAVYALTAGQPMRWVDVRQVGDRLGVERIDLELAFQLGLQKRFLLSEGEPVARVALRDAGLTMVSVLRKRQAAVTQR